MQEGICDTGPRINSWLFKQTCKRKHIIQLLCNLQQGSKFEVKLLEEETRQKKLTAPTSLYTLNHLSRERFNYLA